MAKNESIVQIRDYGKICLKLNEVLDKNAMTRNHLARAINTRFEVVDKWYNNDVEKIDADILARICFVLKCSVGDIIEYVPYEE